MVADIITVVLVTVAVATPIIVLGKSIWDLWSGAAGAVISFLRALGRWGFGFVCLME
jgi:hypothetical protein